MKRKFMKTLAVSILAIAGLASCGGNADSTQNKTSTAPTSTQTSQNAGTSSTETKQHTLKYQYTGENTEYANYGFAYTFYLNLYEDGKIDGYGYKFYSLDTTEAANNSNYAQWFTGSWGKSKDDNDEECLRLVVNYVDGLKSMAGQAISGKYNYEVYEKNGKLTKIDNFNVPLGMSGRTLTLEYNSGDFYTSGDDFIAKTVYKFTAPTSYAALFEDTTNHDRIYLYEDNTGYYYGAATDPKTNTLGYYPKQEVTWSYTDSKLYVSIDSKREVTISGTTGTLAWEEALTSTYTTSHNFSCSDISKLTSKESGGSETSAYAKNTLYFTYNYYPTYHLSATFHSEQASWTAALGSAVTGEYTATESTDTLLDFVNDDTSSSATFTLKKNGTFAFHNTLAGNEINMTGIFTWAHYAFTFTTTAGGSVDPVTTSIQQ
jgi:hypothetical protein